MTLSTRLLLNLALAGSMFSGCSRAPQPAAAVSPLYQKGYQQSDVQTVPKNAQIPAGERQYSKYPVESFRRIRLNEIQAEILSAQKAGSAWANSPLQIVQHFWPAGEEYRSYCLLVDNDGIGADKKTTITIIDNGVGDHMTAGEWHQFRFGRMDRQQPWQIHEWRRAELAYIEGVTTTGYTATSIP